MATPPVYFARGLRTSHGKIRVTDDAIKFMIGLRAAVPYDLVEEMVITSGVRQAEGQARAMLDVLTEGGREYFIDTYGKAARVLLDAEPHDVRTWTPVVERMYNDGLLNAKGHYGGGAVDVRAKGWTSPTISEVKRIAKEKGARLVLVETEPAIHLHIEFPIGDEPYETIDDTVPMPSREHDNLAYFAAESKRYSLKREDDGRRFVQGNVPTDMYIVLYDGRPMKRPNGENLVVNLVAGHSFRFEGGRFYQVG